MSYAPPREEPIAIVGSSCRFPGNASSTNKLWELLKDPIDLSKEVPNSRFSIAGFYHDDGEHHGTTNAAKSYWLEEDHRVFDASFFNITPKEAEAIDPQQKLLLEVVYEAMDSAGFSIQECSGKKISCFVGTMTADYDGLTQKDEQTSSQYCATGTSRAIISNRISYFFNWGGASMTIDTACSSSLVAIHQAILNLRGKESSVSCVAGANIMLGPENFIAESSLHMLSPTGKSKMWDATADGYARADGDSIEGIIRGSGVNSDGRTKGITMPSSESQAALIEDTYKRSGLNPRNPLDRCQYFEAYGTGTQAGDPQEAGAIHEAFYGPPKPPADHVIQESPKLLVGSIKTVIGHTEGAAGIAGLLKAVLAMNHGCIPPNQHLRNLNPAVVAFCQNLEVPTKSTEWPLVPPGQPMRSSVNSFGFGGTNAHVILERYEPSIHDICLPSENVPSPVSAPQRREAGSSPPLPLVLSANSEKALVTTVANFSSYLKAHPQINMRDLTWTLSSRRTRLPHKVSFTEISPQALTAVMDKQLKAIAETPGANLGNRTKSAARRAGVLGIFTGQGAQWPSMAGALLSSSALFGHTIKALDSVLKECPDPPSWSIEDEMLATAQKSRVSEAAISQPVCTALQIGLVDLLRAAGVELYGVVGHSSGEIGAAYAAGILKARDAILIAYYRGVYAHLSCGPRGAKGGMMAVGLDVEEAIKLCDQPHLRGRIFVAASNAPASVTLSGDRAAIETAKTELEDRQKFARPLQVDTAYHSHHMDRCAVPYLHSLQTCNIRASIPDSKCYWVSSVYGPAGTPSPKELEGPYWRDNMVQAVLFNEAVERILREHGPFDAAIEVGPHPALKGPTTQTMKQVVGNTLPYCGTLDRKRNDAVAFGGCLSFLWALPVAPNINFESYASTFDTLGSNKPTLVKGLPSYPWDHSQLHLRETRLARQYLHKSAHPHELLGVRTPDDSEQELRWRNILKPNTIPWIKNHRFQGQIIVPAAAYCVMALDAARVFAGDIPIKMVELLHVRISNAISMEEDSQGVEILFSLVPDADAVLNSDGTVNAKFMLTFTPVEGSLPMRNAVSGLLSITLGDPSPTLLPTRPSSNAEMNPVNMDAFYSSMEDIGLAYSGPFRALLSLQRRMNASSARLEKPHSLDTSGLPVRPTLLDVCFQTAFAAFAAPGDGALWTAFLPQSIRRIRFNLALCDVGPQQQSIMDVDAYVTEFNPTTSEKQANFSGDIEIFNAKGLMEIQIEGMNVASFAASAKENDRELYLHTVWDTDPMSGFDLKTSPIESTKADDRGLMHSCQLVARHFNSLQRSDESQTADTNLEHFIQTSPHQATLRFIHDCGRNMPSVLPVVVDHIVQESQSTSEFHRVARILTQITHRYPRMRILEIGTDGKTTLAILRALKSAFLSYTFAYAEGNQLDLDLFTDWQGKVCCREFNIRGNALDQGYTAGSYDLVIISNVLGKGDSLGDLLKNLRPTLKAGGYLLALDFSRMSVGFRPACRATSSVESNSGPILIDWARLMQSTSFGTLKLEHKGAKECPYLAICQVEDELTWRLQNPLEALRAGKYTGHVLIVGGERSDTQRIVTKLVVETSAWGGRATIAGSLVEVDPEVLDSISAAVILVDLDESIIATLNSKCWTNLRKIFSPNRQVLWLVNGYRTKNPYHHASVGLGRCIKAETPRLGLQFLDLDVVQGSETLVAEAFARLVMTGIYDFGGQLWTTEHEIAIENSKLVIPRLLPLEASNKRLNSIRRVVTTEINTATSPTELIGYEVYGATRYKAQVMSSGGHNYRTISDSITVAVEFSSLRAIQLDAGVYAFVCLGRIVGTTNRVLELSLGCSSIVTVPIDWTHPVRSDGVHYDALLGLTVHFFIAALLPKPGTPGTVVLNGADELLEVAVKQLLHSDTPRVICFSSDAHICDQKPSWIHVHPQQSVRVLRSLVPPKCISFLDLSPDNNTLSATFKRDLPDTVDYHTPSSFLPLRCTPGSETDTTRFAERLRWAASLAIQSFPGQCPRKHGLIVTPASRIVEFGSQSPMEIVDWSQNPLIQEIQKSVKPSTVFSSNRTYILVGLTGQLGQSLCKMMVLSGVRYLVVASRNPERTPRWRQELCNYGAKVMIESIDAARLEDVEQLAKRLSKTMPPVVGVVNGAMVLADGIFADMSLEDFEKVLRPKVAGSKNLDQVFSSSELDLFVMFSSLTAVAGNRGQGNYAAANMYMAGLAAQRRSRGLAASVLDIGMLYGIGYINRTEGAEIYKSLRKQGYRPISEQDIHHMFVEAILAGRPDSGQDPQITTGLQRFSLSDNQPLHWHLNPKFSHHTIESDNDLEASAGMATVSVKQQLGASSSADEVAETLKHCFASQLETMLQLPADGVNKDVPIIELGVDSLVAVEIRSWFIKEVEKDMPVLKVLGGSTLSELCEEVAPGIFADISVTFEASAESISELGTSSESSLGSKTTSSGADTPQSIYSDDLIEEELLELKNELYETIARMSYGQARLWFPYLYLEDKTAYNCTTSYRLRGVLDIARFDRAIHSVIQRHQVFRTRFFTDSFTGHTVQAVSAMSPFSLKIVVPAHDTEDLALETSKVAKHRYDLEAGDVFIATLLSHERELHTIVFGYHHIMIDAVGWQLFLQDLEKSYAMEGVKLGPASKYTDFAKKQRLLMESGGAQDKRNYWISELSDSPSALPLLPFAKVSNRRNLVRYDLNEHFVLLDEKLVADIRKASAAAKTTTFHFYLSVLQVFFARALDIDDMCIGITDANRSDPAFMQTVGFLLDSLPLRFKVSPNERFLDCLQNTRSRVYSALANSGVPLDIILEDLHISAAPNTLPLFQVLVNYRMGALKQKTMGDVQLDYLAYEDAKHPFDSILSIDEDEGAGGLSLSMQDYLYGRVGGDTFLETYIHLLRTFTNGVNQNLNACSLFTQHQRDNAVSLSTGPRIVCDWPETLSLRVDSIVDLHPEVVAIKDSCGSILTYREVAERSYVISSQLEATGVGLRSRIALFCEPCTDAVCSLLAILRIGAVYIPLDVRNTDDRLKAIVDEADADLIISHCATNARIPKVSSASSKNLDLSMVTSSQPTMTSAVLNRSAGSSNAFIMFTSGSTGKPKGIMLTHTNFLTHVIAATERMGIKQEIILQQSAFGYDASLAQIFYALANGGTLVMSSNRREMSELAELMLKEGITFTLCAPSEYISMFQYGASSLAQCSSWKIAMCGGEAFPPHLKSNFSGLNSQRLKLFNAYGPTETSVASNIGQLDYKQAQGSDTARVPIGQAISNYATYILNENAEPTPCGWIGEICIAGAAVARGYLENEALTQSKFVVDRITQIPNEAETSFDQNLYRTGDKGRMLTDGSIEYHGRIDGDCQVKLRGIRIELDDIASNLLQMSIGVVTDAKVVLREDGGALLVAYIVFGPKKIPENPTEYLRKLLLNLPLPVYMRPALAIPIDQLPRNVSGKLDIRQLKSLPLPQTIRPSSSSEELTAVERDLKVIWEDILPMTGLQIQRTSEFFSVGGNSLLLLALQADIRKVFNKTIPLQDLFHTSTLESLASLLQTDTLATNAAVAANIPLSAASIDWEAETAVDPHPSNRALTSREKRRRGRSKEPITVALTGATGFLGKSILKQLDNSEKVSHIHCIAVRQTASNIARSEVFKSPKVTYHAGDLSLPRLGLSEGESRLLFEDVDIIIHNGAEVSFMQSYQSLRKPNVQSTRELVKAIAHRRLPFHYISTAGIAHLSHKDYFDEGSIAKHTPPTYGPEGYVASKWASERYLEKANDSLRLPVWIYRPSSITGQGAPPMDVMQNVLKFSAEMKAVPDLSGWTGFFDFIDVEKVAQCIVKNALPRGQLLQQNVDYIHPSGELVVAVSDVKAFLEKDSGHAFRTLPMNEWVTEASKAGLASLVAAYLNTLGSGSEMPQLPRLGTRLKHSC